MSELLSEEWIAAAGRALAELPPVGDVDAVVQYTVTGGPDGRVVVAVEITSGRVTSLTTGRASAALCKVSLSHESLTDILDGSMSPDVAFMKGAVKVEGDHALWLVGLRDIRAAALAALATLDR